MRIKEEVISSTANPRSKWIASLRDRKGRQNAKSFFVEGEKLSYEALENKLPITHIIVLESKKDTILPKIKSLISKNYDYEIELLLVSENVFSKISSEKAPQGVITVIKYLDFFKKLDIINKEEFFLKDSEKAIILCDLQDPGNLGSVIRSAVAFGVEHIILTESCADIYNTKTVRSAMGSLFRVKVTQLSALSDFIFAAQQNGRRVFAAELCDAALPLDKCGIGSRDIVIIGNEGHGIPKEISLICDSSVYIPISKKTESLNASVAAAIFMWEQNKN